MHNPDKEFAEFLMWIVVVGGIALNIFVDRNVYPREIIKAQELCKEANAELKEFNVGSLYIDVLCSNGAKFRFDAQQVPDSEKEI